MGASPTVTISIIGINEGYHLKRLVEQLEWADEVLYIDCESTDGSLEIAKAAGWNAMSRPNDPNININRGLAIELAKSDWVLYLDPDEELPEDLVAEIKSRISSGEYNAYKLGRKNYFFGKWLRHGGQYPDVQLRLLKSGKAMFPKKHVHERIAVDGKIGKLGCDMIHYPYLDISQYLKKFDFYTTFEARFMLEAGLKPSGALLFKFCVWKPFSRFFRRLFFKGGILDGWRGLFACAFDAMNFFVRYLKMIEMYDAQKGGNGK